MGCHSGSGGGGGAKASGGNNGLEKFRHYEYGLDDEFKNGVGKQLYDKIQNATSTKRLISDIENSGYKVQQHGISGIGNGTHGISFSKEKNGKVENLSVETVERYVDGKRMFWLQYATYSWHKLGD